MTEGQESTLEAEENPASLLQNYHFKSSAQSLSWGNLAIICLQLHKYEKSQPALLLLPRGQGATVTVHTTAEMVKEAPTYFPS